MPADSRRETSFSRMRSGDAGIGSGANRFGDLLGHRVATGLCGVELRDEDAALLGELERAVDQGRILALVGRRSTQQVGFVAQPLEADAHAFTSTPAASRRRRITKSRSSAASSHPARGPDGRPRKAR